MTSYTYGGSIGGMQTGLSYNNITGTDNPEILVGSSGNDYIKGLSGSDILYGGGGFDKLEGGSGMDRFAFQVGQGYDTIIGFNSSQDKILLPSDISYGQLTFNNVNGMLDIIYNNQVWMRIDNTTANTLASTVFTQNSIL
jgi:Ca2+-binding RTX toxin-like protein